MVFITFVGVTGLVIDLLDEDADETLEVVRSMTVSARDSRSWSCREPPVFDNSPDDAVRESMRFASPLFREGDGSVGFKIGSEPKESNITLVPGGVLGLVGGVTGLDFP